MKVLMATMKLDIGGAETHIVELSKALKRRGVDVWVASAGGAYENELREAGVNHIYVPMSEKNPSDVMTSYNILKKLIKRENFDVVHGHARIPCFILNMIRRSVNFRFVTTAHWVFSLRFPYKYISKWGDRSLAVSDDIKKYLIDNYGIKPENIRVTINGIDTAKFSKNTDYSDVAREFDLRPEKRRIVYVSRMDEDRSLAAHKLIAIAEKLDKEINDLEILIVGGGNDFKAVRDEADAVNDRLKKSLIKYTGSRTDINKLVASGEIFVGVSRAALEAMAAEKPSIIAGNEGYIGIFSRDKLETSIDTNFCCRGCGSTTEEKLLRDITALMKMSTAERDALGSYAKEVVEKYYSIETMADDAMKMYISVIKNEGINDVSVSDFDCEAEYPPPPQKNREYDVMISGYYGFDNSGDDSILKAIISNLRELRPDIKILVLSNDPKETSSLFGVDSEHRFNIAAIRRNLKKTKLLISGGGSLIQDITSDKSLAYYLFIIETAARLGTRVILYANGIGPILNRRNYPKIRHALGKADLITLREKSSLDELNKIGVDNPNIQVTADPAFTLSPCSDEAADEILSKCGISPDEDFVCVSIRPWKTLGENFESEIAESAKYIYKQYGIKTLFVPMQCPKDTEISKRAAKLSGTCGLAAPENLTPSEILGVAKRSRLVIGMRLHMLIYAASVATPIIGLIYDPKVSAVIEYIGRSDELAVENLSSAELDRIIDRVMLSCDSISAELKKSTAELAKLAKLNAEKAIEIISK